MSHLLLGSVGLFKRHFQAKIRTQNELECVETPTLQNQEEGKKDDSVLFFIIQEKSYKAPCAL